MNGPQKYFVKMGLCALVALVAAAIYTYLWNPDVGTRAEILEKQLGYAKELHELGVPKVVFTAGSSTRFSVRPDVLREEFGIQGVNLGVGASAGPPFMIALVMQYLREGDTLVIGFENIGFDDPDPFMITPDGLQLIAAMKMRGLWNPPHLEGSGFSFQQNYFAHRPDLRHLVTMSGKLLLRRPIFRYQPEDMESGGYMTTDYSEGALIPGNALKHASPQVSPARMAQLRQLKEFCDERGIKLYYTQPWFYTAEDAAEYNRAWNLEQAQFLSEVVPVLADRNQGVQTSPDLFSDTNWHLNREGAKLRTRILGESLKNNLTVEIPN